MAEVPQVVILAAGLGTRLRTPIPKCLTALADGRTILQTQIEAVQQAWGPDVPIVVVVGFKFELVMEYRPDVTFAYNEMFDRTNTAKSLLKAFTVTRPSGTMWLNGDVVLDAQVMQRCRAAIDTADESFVCVNRARVGDEEVKYTLDDDGRIAGLSKTVAQPAGEAVGVNYVTARDRLVVARELDAVAPDQYFERALELAIEAGELRLRPLDVSDLFVVEIDFDEDLKRANSWLETGDEQ